MVGTVEWLCGILGEFGITFQHTRTRKASPAPCFEAKKNRILELYDDLPADG